MTQPDDASVPGTEDYTEAMATPYPDDGPTCEPPSDPEVPEFRRVGYRTLGSLDSVVRLLVAIGQAKAEFGEIIKNREVSYTATSRRTGERENLHYKYATLANIDAATKKALAAAQVHLFFLPVRETEDRIDMVCMIGGHGAIIESVFRFYGHQVSDMRSTGGSTTYLRRYVTSCVLNIEGDLDEDEVPQDVAPRLQAEQPSPRRGQAGARPSTPRAQQQARAPAERPAQRQAPEQRPAPSEPPAQRPASAPEQKREAKVVSEANWKDTMKTKINEVFSRVSPRLTDDKMRAIIRQALDEEDPPKFRDMTTEQVSQLWNFVKTLETPDSGASLQ